MGCGAGARQLPVAATMGVVVGSAGVGLLGVGLWARREVTRALDQRTASARSRTNAQAKPVENPEHDLRIQSITLQTALMLTYVALRLSELTVALGAGSVAIGVGLAAAGRGGR